MDTYFYRGLYKVKLLTESEGYWIVEAQEEFEDQQEGKRIKVKVGEQRIVQPNELHKKKVLPPPVPEHSYELCLEKKVKRMVKEYEKETSPNH
jgi:hypothetical protein